MELSKMKLSKVFAVFLTLTACAENKLNQETIVESANSEVSTAPLNPLVSVKQTTPTAPQQAFRNVLKAFENHGLGFADVNQANATANSAWQEVSDYLCVNRRKDSTPTKCRLQLHAKVKPWNKSGSEIELKYTELCSVNEDVQIICRDSVGEKTMLSILGQVSK